MVKVKKIPIFNQNFSVFMERKGFNRDIDFIEETRKGIVISIQMNETEKEEWIPKILFEDDDIREWHLNRFHKDKLKKVI